MGWREEEYYGHSFSIHTEDSICLKHYDIEETFDIDCNIGDVLFLVYAIYETGSTFGRIYGCVSVQGLFKTQEQARECLQECEKEKGYSKPWNGYFESLTSLDVDSFILKD